MRRMTRIMTTVMSLRPQAHDLKHDDESKDDDDDVDDEDDEDADLLR